MLEIRNGFQDMAAGIQRFGSINATEGVLAREQDYSGIDECPRGDALAQGLAERRCGCHAVMRRGCRHCPSFYSSRQLDDRKALPGGDD